MKSRFTSMAALAAVGAAILLLTGGTGMQAADKNQPLSGTIYGKFDYAQMAWVGHVILQIGTGEPVVGTFLDRSDAPPNLKPNGAIYGTETITITPIGGSDTFQILARFNGVPGPTPGLYNLHEVGTIAHGTGKYQNLSGHVSVQGPFMMPFPPPPGEALWIAEIHGSLSGL